MNKSSSSQNLAMLRIVLLSIAVSMFLLNTSDAQRRGSNNTSSLSDDIMLRVLQNGDANRDGTLSPSETSSRTKDFIRRAGLDPGKPHALQTIAQKAKAGNNKSSTSKGSRGSASGNTGSNAGSGEGTRKVEGFGVGTERLGVADFSPSGEERMTVDAMKRKFGDSVMVQVERTITRYDKDKNGLIDQSEQRRTRWTNPSASESDTNGDGNLSRVELAYRYKNREDAALKRTSKTSSTSAKTTKAVSAPKSFSNRSANYSRSSSSKSNPSRSSGTSSRYKKPSSAKPFNSGSDAYRRYAEGLLKNYDKNKDQKLSRTELKEMRRPPENADTNKDGYVDKNELIDSVSRRSGNTNSSGVRKSSASRAANSNEAAGRLRREPKNLNARDDVFGGKDTNSDGQLQMAEFEDEWDKEKVAEFKEKDLNGDGVITAKEWHSGAP